MNDEAAMLGDAEPVGFLAVSDFGVARAFYEGVLGLTFVSQDGFALVLRGGGMALRLAVPPSRVVADYTVFGWHVSDIGSVVAALGARGVAFQHYDFFGGAQDSAGIWTTPGGDKVAWFRDPDGNLLSVSESNQ